MRHALALAALTLAAPARADCPVGADVFMTCTFSNGAKRLETCRGDGLASYWFGKSDGRAELALTAQAGEFSYTPWPGVSRTIWEELSFQNNGVTYTVQGAHERIWPESQDAEVTVITTGGVIVSQNGTDLARLTCDPGSVDFRW